MLPLPRASQSSHDLGIGLGSVALGAFLDLVDQNFSLMYAVTSMIAFLGLWVYWKSGEYAAARFV